MEKLYSLGSQILIIGSNKENLQKTKSKYPKILIEAFDLGDHNQITNLFKNCMHQIGGLDVLINNAGITRDNLAIRMSKDEWSKVIDVNLTSSFLMSQEAIKLMLKTKRGRLLI